MSKKQTAEQKLTALAFKGTCHWWTVFFQLCTDWKNYTCVVLITWRSHLGLGAEVNPKSWRFTVENFTWCPARSFLDHMRLTHTHRLCCCRVWGITLEAEFHPGLEIVKAQENFGILNVSVDCDADTVVIRIFKSRTKLITAVTRLIWTA